METIKPNKIRCSLSRMVFGFVYMISFISLQCLIAWAFGSKYQYLKESLILLPAAGILIGSFSRGIARRKKLEISILEHTIAQDKKRVKLESAKVHESIIGIKITDEGNPYKIWCTKFHFSIGEINRLKQIIKPANQQVDPIVKTPVDEVEAQSTQAHP